MTMFPVIRMIRIIFKIQRSDFERKLLIETNIFNKLPVQFNPTCKL